MKTIYSFVFALVLLVATSCGSNGQAGYTTIKAAEFKQMLDTAKSAQVVDVRTEKEFNEGHLAGAVNYNWNSNNFEQQASSLDKSKTVYVYCLSGGRSSDAASKLSKMGYKHVYMLDGGLMKWRAAGLPEEGKENGAMGMTKEQFDHLLQTDKLVLVDFYAEWCKPCKQMEPHLKAIAGEMKDKVTVVRIDADNNQLLAEQMHIDALPTLYLYKGGERIWDHIGYMDKESIKAQLIK